MAIEIFEWVPDDEATSDGTFRVRKCQFGDGYAQVSGDGPNSEEAPWSLTFGGTEAEMAPILSFVRRHDGHRSFLWTPPGDDLGLYRCPTFRRQRKPGGLVVLSLTFERAYHP